MTNSDAVPAQVDGECPHCWLQAGHEGECQPPAEPQAGAQVPSQDQLRWDAIIKWAYANVPDAVVAIRDLAKEVVDNRTALQRIRDYVTEAAKTPITREKILDEPKVDAPMPDDLRAKYEMCGKASNGKYVFSLDECKALIERIVRLEAALNARKQTELAQYDEMQGLCRLVLSETGK